MLIWTNQPTNQPANQPINQQTDSNSTAVRIVLIFL